MAILFQPTPVQHHHLPNIMNSQYPSPLTGTASPSNQKPHNACDECRARKLKCSGELTGCSRCRADSVPCRYSPRKQMGRPRKKRKEEEQYQQAYNSWNIDASPGAMGSPPAQTGSNMMYQDINMPLQQSSAAYAAMGPGNTISPGMPMDMGGANLNYIDPCTSLDLLPDVDLSGIDFSNINLSTSPNPAADYYTAASQTPPRSSGLGSSSSNYSSPPPFTSPPAPIPTPPTSAAPTRSSSLACTCQPQLYKALQALPKYTSPPTFPQSLPPLKHATRLASTLLHCQACPTTYASALQNSMGSVTLLNLIIVTYHKLLSHIDARAKSASKLKFRFGEAGVEGHTGTVDCPMGVDVELSGPEWRTLARKAVMRELLGGGEQSEGGGGAGEGVAGQGSVMDVLKGLRARQKEYHGTGKFHGDVNHQHNHPQQQHQAGRSGAQSRSGKGTEKENCICVQGLYFEQLIRQVMSMDF